MNNFVGIVGILLICQINASENDIDVIGSVQTVMLQTLMARQDTEPPLVLENIVDNVDNQWQDQEQPFIAADMQDLVVDAMVESEHIYDVTENEIIYEPLGIFMSFVLSVGLPFCITSISIAFVYTYYYRWIW